MKYLLSIDQGTTGTTATIVNATTMKFVGSFNTEFQQIYPKPSWVEHQLEDIWESVKTSVIGVLKKTKTSPNSLQAIGITNQRETTAVFNSSGKPLYNAIVWQDRRTADFCEKTSLDTRQWIKEKTGLPLDPYFSATKMRWILEHIPKIKNNPNDSLFGTIDTFLLFKLTSGYAYKTEPSNASRTLLMNINSCQWDKELIQFFGLEQIKLPEIINSFDHFGITKGLDFLPDGLPITGMLGDQQAALFGQGCVNCKEMKCTYGTGAFILINTGTKPMFSKNGLVTTVAYQHSGSPCYALEGSTFIAGAAVQYLRDNLRIISQSHEIELLANTIKNLDEMEHVLFLPFFTGIGSPYWISSAKAAILGLTRDTTTSHIARSCLEGIALSINDLISAIELDLGEKIQELRVDGGACTNDLLMSMQATISELTIHRPSVIETTSYGAALACAVGSKSISLDHITNLCQIESTFRQFENHVSYFLNKKILWKEWMKKLYLS